PEERVRIGDSLRRLHARVESTGTGYVLAALLPDHWQRKNDQQYDRAQKESVIHLWFGASVEKVVWLTVHSETPHGSFPCSARPFHVPPACSERNTRPYKERNRPSARASLRPALTDQ